VIRAITIRQPWATAVTHGPKRVDTRARCLSTGWYLIHAGEEWDHGADTDPAYTEWISELASDGEELKFSFSEIIGVVHVAECHESASPQCCAPWGRWSPIRSHHIIFDRVVALSTPIPCLGKFGSWTVSSEVEDAVREQVSRQIDFFTLSEMS
jgi:hypothetical protein